MTPTAPLMSRPWNNWYELFPYAVKYNWVVHLYTLILAWLIGANRQSCAVAHGLPQPNPLKPVQMLTIDLFWFSSHQVNPFYQIKFHLIALANQYWIFHRPACKSHLQWLLLIVPTRQTNAIITVGQPKYRVLPFAQERQPMAAPNVHKRG